MRLAIAVLLLASSSLAQAKPDFSGVFLRTETTANGRSETAIPRILDIKQTADEVQVTALQNGETAVAHYPLGGKKTEKVQARLKGNYLQVKTTVKWQFSSAAWLWPTLPLSETVSEKWELSPDGSQLTIKMQGAGSDESEAYVRKPSLEAAKAEAGSAATKECGSAPSIFALRSLRQGTRRYAEGADLGAALLRRVTQCVWYSAAISGDFFKNLERSTESGLPRFHKNALPVSTYTGDIVLEVAPRPQFCSGEVGAWEPAGTLPTEAALNLRFIVRWMGMQQKDLGEIESEFRYEPWRELSTPLAFYRMRIPAQDIPLTDELEVLIYSKSGEQLACIKGHI